MVKYLTRYEVISDSRMKIFMLILRLNLVLLKLLVILVHLKK